MAGLTEILGMTSQLAATESKYINSIEAPAIFFLQGFSVILQELKRKSSDSSSRAWYPEIADTRSTRDYGRKIRYVLPRRTANTPKVNLMELVYTST